MTQHKMIVLSDAVDGRDDAYNDWYTNTHLADVMKVAGVTGAQRFRLDGGGKWKYLAIYELDCDDPKTVVAEVMARAGTEAMQISDAFDVAGHFMAVASPITDYKSK